MSECVIAVLQIIQIERHDRRLAISGIFRYPLIISIAVAQSGRHIMFRQFPVDLCLAPLINLLDRHCGRLSRQQADKQQESKPADHIRSSPSDIVCRHVDRVRQ